MNINMLLSDTLLQDALKHVCRKKGCCGYDQMTASELPAFWRQNAAAVKEAIQNGAYRPKPLITRCISKQRKGKKRKLEIPSLMDRMLLYALVQVLTPYYEPSFSSNSYGFRPGLGCMDALHACLEHLNNQTACVVDLDIKSFFDHVNHRLLFSMLEQDIKDPALMKLIQRYVRAKVVCGRHTFQKYIGLPQGSSVSPLLANIFLNYFDHFLERNNIRFIRYADDIVLFCASRSEAEWSLSIAREYLSDRLKLELNEEKTKIVSPCDLHFLGYAFSSSDGQTYSLTIDDATKQKMMLRMKRTIHMNHLPLLDWWRRIGAFNRGWINYHKEADPYVMFSFLSCAEQNQLSWIVNKSTIYPKPSSREFVSALYNCGSYSSLTGWYLSQCGDQLNLSERRIQMTNKYFYWRSANFYNCTDRLASQYESLISKPFYFTEDCALDVSHFQKPVFPDENMILDNTEYMVLGILASGKNMTALQVYSYLLLKNISVSLPELSQILQRFIDVGILERNTIYPVFSESKTCISRRLDCYRISLGGTRFVRDICAPVDYEINYHYLRQGRHGLLYYYTTTILWNQILLNYLLYVTPEYYFHIAAAVTQKDNKNCAFAAEIPFMLESEDHILLFDYLYKPSDDKVSGVYRRWCRVQNKLYKKITYVLVVNNYADLLFVKNSLLKETMLNSKISLDSIRFSIVHSWFQTCPGVYLSYNDIK